MKSKIGKVFKKIKNVSSNFLKPPKIKLKRLTFPVNRNNSSLIIDQVENTLGMNRKSTKSEITIVIDPVDNRTSKIVDISTDDEEMEYRCKSPLPITPLQSKFLRTRMREKRRSIGSMLELYVTKMKYTNQITKNYIDGYKCINQYSVRKLLGVGAQGKVYLVIHSQTQQKFAMKVIKKSLLRSSRRGLKVRRGGLGQFENELNVLRKLDHRNCIRLLEILNNENVEKIYLIFEYAERGCVGQISSMTGKCEKRRRRRSNHDEKETKRKSISILKEIEQEQDDEQQENNIDEEESEDDNNEYDYTPASSVSSSFSSFSPPQPILLPPPSPSPSSSSPSSPSSFSSSSSSLSPSSFDYLSSYSFPLSEIQSGAFFLDLLCGVKYLHEQNIIHRDLKPSNLLIMNDGTLKISDFGESSFISDYGDRLTSRKGTAHFLPPEATYADVKFISGKMHDIWSMGVCLFVFCFGCLPFFNLRNPKSVLLLFEAIQKVDIRNRIKEEKMKNIQLLKKKPISEACCDLMIQMMNKDPLKRITLREIWNHRWVKEQKMRKSERIRRRKKRKKRRKRLISHRRTKTCAFQNNKENRDQNRKRKKEKKNRNRSKSLPSLYFYY